MEILTYVLSGTLKHQDSMGNGNSIGPGDLQAMSAGSGITHSEFNASLSDPVHFLQIWILPTKTGLTPSYSEWRETATPQSTGVSQIELVLMASPNGANGSALIHQDASVWRIALPGGAAHTIQLQPERAGWIQIVEGALTANEQLLLPGDGLAIEDEPSLTLKATAQSRLLWFDLP
jgi:redox-sensitive bicupin YhaK (pirin superfamily)